MQQLIQNEFNLHQNIVYLNHAAVSPWPARTTRAVQVFAEENMVEGSSHYLKWLDIETNLRNQAALLLNARSEDIALLKNTSEALSVVAYGLNWNDGDNIVSTNQEFPSNRIVWESLSAKGVEFREAYFGGEGTPEDALFSLVDSRTKMITVSSVQYSSGLKLNLKLIGEFCTKHEILFCVDAIQSIGAMQFDLKESQADFVMADGHKWMCGPEGVAVFYSTPDGRDRINLKQYGWHMVEAIGNFDQKEWSPAKSARRFECGSPNMLGIHALNASLSVLLEAGIKEIEREILDRAEYLFQKINANSSLDLITSQEAGRYSGIVSFRHTGTDNQSLYDHLMKNNIICSLRGGAIRFSPHFYTSYEDIDKAMGLVEDYSGH